MHRLRWLLATIIVALVFALGAFYHSGRTTAEHTRTSPPPPLPTGVQAVARNWHWSQNAGDKPAVEISAAGFRQEGESIDLEDVELKLFRKDGQKFDLIRSRHATFDVHKRVLYSDGDVQITMGMQEQGPPGRLLTIYSSGVTFDSQTGKASTDRLAKFEFDTAHGQSMGASYDPGTKELILNDRAEVHWRGSQPGARPMKVETAKLVYREAESQIVLSPWSRLTRDTFTLEAATAYVHLENGEIRTVDTSAAKGSERQPERTVEYAADGLQMRFGKRGEVERITAGGNARLSSTAQSGSTNVTADRLEMDFALSEQGSALTKALALGKAEVESRPAAKAQQPRILRSETIELSMRPGGEEIASVNTHSPGTLEFAPVAPGDRRRVLTGERMWIDYAAKNQIESFRSVEVTTRTESEPRKGLPLPPQLTWSKNLQARFDPQSGQMTILEQWQDFRYEEGERHANAERATLAQPANEITLEGAARMWDQSGSTAADTIVLDQKTGDFRAAGKVTSTRKPDKSKQPQPLLSGDAPLQATAARMSTSQGNAVVRYEGGAVLWQGSNRLEAEHVDIDRRSQRVLAERGVVTHLVDKNPRDRKAGDVLTVVRSSSLDYSGEKKVALYQGGAVMTRPGVEVRGATLRAFLKEGGDSAFEKAFADGDVRVMQARPASTRRGKADHGEYYLDEERLVLTGGAPEIVDSVQGTTNGDRLTLFAGNDRLLVDGQPTKPAVSRINRK